MRGLSAALAGAVVLFVLFHVLRGAGCTHQSNETISTRAS